MFLIAPHRSHPAALVVAFSFLLCSFFSSAFSPTKNGGTNIIIASGGLKNGVKIKTAIALGLGGDIYTKVVETQTSSPSSSVIITKQQTIPPLETKPKSLFVNVHGGLLLAEDTATIENESTVSGESLLDKIQDVKEEAETEIFQEAKIDDARDTIEDVELQKLQEVSEKAKDITKQIEQKQMLEEDEVITQQMERDDAKLEEQEVSERLDAEQELEREKEEAAAQTKAEEEARLQAEEAAEKKAAEEEARVKAQEAEQKAQLKAEEEARMKADEEARLKAEKAEEEARMRAAEEAARLKADEEATRAKAEEQARLEEERAQEQEMEAAAKVRAERLEAEVRRLESEIESKDQQATDLEAERKRLQYEVSTMQQEQEDARIQMNARAKTLESEVQRLQNEKAAVESASLADKERIAQIEEQIAKLETDANELVPSLYKRAKQSRAGAAEQAEKARKAADERIKALQQTNVNTDQLLPLTVNSDKISKSLDLFKSKASTIEAPVIEGQLQESWQRLKSSSSLSSDIPDSYVLAAASTIVSFLVIAVASSDNDDSESDSLPLGSDSYDRGAASFGSSNYEGPSRFSSSTLKGQSSAGTPQQSFSGNSFSSSKSSLGQAPLNEFGQQSGGFGRGFNGSPPAPKSPLKGSSGSPGFTIGKQSTFKGTNSAMGNGSMNNKQSGGGPGFTTQPLPSTFGNTSMKGAAINPQSFGGLSSVASNNSIQKGPLKGSGNDTSAAGSKSLSKASWKSGTSKGSSGSGFFQ